MLKKPENIPNYFFPLPNTEGITVFDNALFGIYPWPSPLACALRKSSIFISDRSTLFLALAWHQRKFNILSSHRSTNTEWFGPVPGRNALFSLLPGQNHSPQEIQFSTLAWFLSHKSYAKPITIFPGQSRASMIH